MLNIGDKVVTTQGDVGVIVDKEYSISFDKNNKIVHQWIVELTLDGQKVKLPFFNYELYKE